MMRTGLVLAVLTVCVGTVVGRAFYYETEESVEKRSECPVHNNEAMHAIFDRICDMCHEMFHTTSPNLRTECRANCFDNDQFKLCLAQYNPASGGGLSIPPVVRRNSRRWRL